MTVHPPSGDLHIFEIARLTVDADAGRGDPARVFARLVARLHQRNDEGHVVFVGQPVAALRVPLIFGEDFAGRADALALELADPAIEALVRLDELEIDSGLFDRLVPAIDPALAIDYEVVEQPGVEGAERRRLFRDELAVDDAADGIGRVLQNVVVALEVRFIEAPLDARAEHLG